MIWECQNLHQFCCNENRLNPPQAAVCAPHPATKQTKMVYITISAVFKLLPITFMLDKPTQ